MASYKPCEFYTLAQNPVAHVQRCDDCGCVAVHIGPFTVRLDDAGLEALWSVLGEAAAELHARKSNTTQVQAPSRGLA